MALSEIIEEVIKEWEEFTGQIGGEIALTESQRIEIFGWKVTVARRTTSATNERNLFWVYLVALAAVLLIGIWIARSPAKREAIAMRDQYDGRRDDRGADAAGPHRDVRARFVRSARSPARCSCTGTGSPSPQEFSVELGLGIFVMLIVGGIESLWGPMLGAAFYVWVPYFLQRTATSSCSATRSASTTRSSTARCCCS